MPKKKDVADVAVEETPVADASLTPEEASPPASMAMVRNADTRLAVLVEQLRTGQSTIATAEQQIDALEEIRACARAQTAEAESTHDASLSLLQKALLAQSIARDTSSEAATTQKVQEAEKVEQQDQEALDAARLSERQELAACMRTESDLRAQITQEQERCTDLRKQYNELLEVRDATYERAGALAYEQMVTTIIERQKQVEEANALLEVAQKNAIHAQKSIEQALQDWPQLAKQAIAEYGIKQANSDATTRIIDVFLKFLDQMEEDGENMHLTIGQTWTNIEELFTWSAKDTTFASVQYASGRYQFFDRKRKLLQAVLSDHRASGVGRSRTWRANLVRMR